MVIKEDVSPKYWTAPRDEREKAIEAQVREELSSVYLKGKPGYRVEITDAKHMTFCAWLSCLLGLISVGVLVRIMPRTQK